MRIAQVAPLIEAVPPKLYGGTERVVAWLADALVDMGHQVTLFASGDSQTKAKLIPGSPRGLRLSGIRDQTASHLALLNEVLKREQDFDVIHCHIDLLPFAMFNGLEHKCLITLHGRLDLPDAWPAYHAFPRMPLVSISDDQRRPMPPGMNWLATVHHGLPPQNCLFDAKGGEYLAFLGRLAPEKAPARAIEIAKRSGVPLKIAAKVDPADQHFFRTEIEPLLAHPLIEYIGEIDETAKSRFLGGARALLFPIDWPEPFGLVMIEAMSAGTPVIAWRNGSVPEVIADGVSGVIVSSLEEAIVAVDMASTMPRRAVRNYFESKFTAERMAIAYVEAYRALLARSAPARMLRAAE